MNELTRSTLRLKAAVEFGSEYTYSIVNGGLGPTLRVNAVTREKAGVIRKILPTEWEGLYTLVVYYTGESGEEEDLYDPNLS